MSFLSKTDISIKAQENEYHLSKIGANYSQINLNMEEYYDETEINYQFELNEVEYSIDDTFDTAIFSRQKSFKHSKDWLVFFHIQKTSGTNFDIGFIEQVSFNQNGLWKKGCESLKIQLKGRKYLNRYKRTQYKTEYECKRADNVSWYLSWHERNFGWKCGIHPSLTQMRSCLKEKFPKENSLNFHFVTMLRSPIKRYISEWSIKN